MKNEKEIYKKITTYEAIKMAWCFSFPIMLNSLLNILPSIASIWILARLGKDQLAAAGLATPTFYTILTLFVSGFYAVGIKVGHSFGKDNNNSEIKVWVENGFMLAIILTIPAIIILLNIHILLIHLGQRPHLIAIAEPFFFYGALAILPMLFNSVLNQYFSGIGHPKIALFFSLITLPLIIGLSYILVLGRLGIHQFGLGGINLASFIVDCVISICGIIITLNASWSNKHKIFSSPINVSYKKCLEIFKLGWPISVQVSGELCALTIATYLLGLFGTSALAASQITQQYSLLFFMLSLGLSSGITILISHCHGSNNLQNITKLTQAGTIINLGISSLFGCGFIFFPHSLINIYLSINQPGHSQVVRLAIYFMMIAAAYMTIDGLRNIYTATLRALQDPKIPMQIGILSLWLIGLPCGFIAGFLLHGGPIALRSAYISGVSIATILVYLRYKKKMNTLKIS